VPDTGTCTLVSASGAYGALRGTGKVTGSAELGVAGVMVSETVKLMLH
jgi:hypothetical protein